MKGGKKKGQKQTGVWKTATSNEQVVSTSQETPQAQTEQPLPTSLADPAIDIETKQQPTTQQEELQTSQENEQKQEVDVQLPEKPKKAEQKREPRPKKGPQNQTFVKSETEPQNTTLSVSESGVPQEELKGHVLHSRWTLWYDGPKARENKNIKYEDRLIKIGTFQTLEDFFRYYVYVKRPLELGTETCNLHLFRDEIKPMWEVSDKKNKSCGVDVTFFFVEFPQRRMLE